MHYLRCACISMCMCICVHALCVEGEWEQECYLWRELWWEVRLHGHGNFRKNGGHSSFRKHSSCSELIDYSMAAVICWDPQDDGDSSHTVQQKRRTHLLWQVLLLWMTSVLYEFLSRRLILHCNLTKWNFAKMEAFLWLGLWLVVWREFSHANRVLQKQIWLLVLGCNLFHTNIPTVFPSVTYSKALGAADALRTVNGINISLQSIQHPAFSYSNSKWDENAADKVLLKSVTFLFSKATCVDYSYLQMN